MSAKSEIFWYWVDIEIWLNTNIIVIVYEVTTMKIKLELTNQSKNPSVGFGDQAEQQRGSHQAHTPSNCFF